MRDVLPTIIGGFIAWVLFGPFGVWVEKRAGLDNLPDPQAGDDEGMSLEECETLIMTRPTAARNLGRYEGAAAAFGLMGMAEAIRNRCTCLTTEELRALRGPGLRRWHEVCERCKGYP